MLLLESFARKNHRGVLKKFLDIYIYIYIALCKLYFCISFFISVFILRITLNSHNSQCFFSFEILTGWSKDARSSKRWWWRWRGTKRNGRKTAHQSCTEAWPKSLEEEDGVGERRRSARRWETSREVRDWWTSSPTCLIICHHTQLSASTRLRNRSYACCHGFTPIIVGR